MTVLLFARARDLVGADRIELDLPAGATVRHLRAKLSETYPKLRNLLASCTIALGDEYAEEDAIIGNGVDAAVIPPVSGG